MENVFINASRDAYSPEQIRETMTVAELIKYLENNFDGDENVYFKFDNGYTYGAITESSFDSDEE